MEITEYILLCSYGSEDLTTSVNDHLRNGWQLSGTAFADPARYLYQPMVKYTPNITPIQGALNEAND